MADPTALSKLSVAKRALVAAKSLNEVLAVGDMAAAIRAYAKASGESLEVQNAASELRLDAERKAGELLSGMDEIGKGKKSNTLLDLGVTHMQSSRWQLAAKLPEPEYATIVANCNAVGKELTQAAILQAARIYVFGKTEPVKPVVGGNSNLLDLIAMARKAIAALVEVFGDKHAATLVGVLKDELETLEGSLNDSI